MKPIDKNIVKSAALFLINKYGSTTAIDVKNRLRNTGFQAFKADVSTFMNELINEENWKTSQVHNYTVYQPNTQIRRKRVAKKKPPTQDKHAHLMNKKISSCKIHYYDLILTEKQEALLNIDNQKQPGYILSTKSVGCILNWPLPKLNTLKDTLGAEQWNIQKFPLDKISYSGQKLKKQEAYTNTDEILNEYQIHNLNGETQLMSLEINTQNLATVEMVFEDNTVTKLSKFDTSLEKLKPLLIKIIDFTINSSN